MKNTKIKHINISLIDQVGFSHLLLPIIVALFVIGSGILVFSANHPSKTTNASVNLTTARSALPATSSSASASSAASAPSTKSPSPVVSTKSSTSSSAKPTSSPTTPSTSSSQSSNSSSGGTTSTPLSVLTSLISGLDAGSTEAQVTAQNVTIPGPISNATGRPIEFSANGQTYFAYTQETEPNFNTSASQTASSMAIVQASGSYTLVPAYLDKAAILVDSNQVAVGFSTGGN